MVVAMVRQLLAAGVSPGDIGVVTPYLAQVGTAQCAGFRAGWSRGLRLEGDVW